MLPFIAKILNLFKKDKYHHDFQIDEYGCYTMLLHREDGPAIEYKNGDKAWYKFGVLHRLDGPAIDNINGYKAWFVDGKLHREDGPAVVSHISSTKNLYYLNGKKIYKAKLERLIKAKNKCKLLKLDENNEIKWK